jgi:hypothetical protein
MTDPVPTAANAAAPAPGNDLGSLAERAAPTPRARVWVLIDPRRAFAAVLARPLAGLAVAVVLAFALVPPTVFLARVDAAAVVERELKKSGRLDQVPADQQEQIRTMGATAMKVALPLGAVVKRVGFIMLATGLIFLLMRGARPELRFSLVLAAVALGCAPLVVHDLLVALTFLVKDPTAVGDAQNVVLSNPAAWFGLDTGRSLLGALLRGFDFFELWACALIALGVNVVASTKSTVPWLASYGLHFAGVVLSLIGPAMAGKA